ncbi:MAG TPA: hypothetical protein V6C81_27265 [Planktothrix sp.]|jgi:hypothetical protein
MRANGLSLATALGALSCLTFAANACSADELTSQYGTRHAYQTAAYGNNTRKRYQSVASQAASILEAQRQGLCIVVFRRNKAYAYPTSAGRRAYQTQMNSKPLEKVGTRRAYQT